MTMFDPIPAFIRILIVFAIVLLAIRKKLSLGNAFIIGAACLGLFFGMPVPRIIMTMLTALVHLNTLALAAIVALILVLSHSMDAAGQMERLLDRFQGLFRHAGFNMIVFPALIGLLPMPGGAIFSAPMVKTLGNRHQMTGARLSYINYWFRHIWEYWWPLYPGVLLTTALAGIGLWTFVLFLIPMTAAAVTLGYWPLRGLQDSEMASRSKAAHGLPQLRQFGIELTPILIVILVGLGLGMVLTPVLESRGIPIAKEIGLITALLLSIGWVWRHNHLSAAERRAVLTRRDLLRMIYMVAGIIIFKEVLMQSHAAGALSEELIRWKIPLFSITVILPMLVGAVTGLTIAFVGTTFPILISLIQSLGQTDLMLAYMMLATVSGFVGVLFSPLHLCLLLSNEYFKTSLSAVYRCLIPPCAGLLLAGCGYFMLLRI